MPIHRRAVGKAQICTSLSEDELVKLEAYAIRYRTHPGALIRAYVQALPKPTSEESAMALAKLHLRRQRQVGAQVTRATAKVDQSLNINQVLKDKLDSLANQIETETDDPIEIEEEKCEDCNLTAKQKIKSFTLQVDQQTTTRRLCEACIAAYKQIEYGVEEAEEKGGEVDGRV